MALNVTTGEVIGQCRRSRDGAEFLALLRKAVAPHRGREVQVVLHNMSTHTPPDVQAWLQANPHVQFHFTPMGSSWMNQIETWFGIITKQAIRRGAFSSVQVLIRSIRGDIATWSANPRPLQWTATADDILAKVELVQTSIKQLVANNAK